MRPRAHAREALGLPPTGGSCSSPAAAGASATSRARSRRRFVLDVAGRRASAAATTDCARGSTRRYAADPRVRVVRVHRPDERVAGGRRRADALDRRADRARGDDARLPDDLVRLGPRPHPRATTRAFRRFGLADVAARRSRSSAPALRPRASERRPRAGLALGSLPLRRRSLVLALVGVTRRLVLAGAAPLAPRHRARATASTCRAPPRRGVALTFDDGPHAEGTPAVLERARARGRDRDVLPRRRAGASAGPASRARSSPPATRSAPRLPAHAAAAPHASRALARRPRPRRDVDRRGDRPRADALPAAVRCLQLGALAHVRAARLAAAAVVDAGDATGAPRDARARSRARDASSAAGRRRAPARRRPLQPPDSWRRTAAALPCDHRCGRRARRAVRRSVSHST